MPDEQPTKQRPKPYKVDASIHKIQTLDEDGDQKYLFRHDFARLDATNVEILYQREKDTKRVTEKLTKGRTRPRVHSDDADRTFYRAFIQGGGWRPWGLDPKEDESLIPPSVKQYYSLNEETKIWEPGWVELTKSTMSELTVEKMTEAIERWLLCKGKSVSSGTIDFMFEKGGLMKVSLGIGDMDTPTYNLLFEMRRPDSKRRTKFKEDFAYSIEESKGGGLGKIETVIDLRQAISFFDEYFATCPDDENYSEILFDDKRDFAQQGREPQPVSAVPTEGEVAPELEVRKYSEELRGELLTYFNPHFKVEVAAAAIASFSRTDQES